MKSLQDLRFLPTLLFCLAFPSFSVAQSSLPDTASIDGQIEFILNEANNYQDYKVVPRNWLSQLQSRVSDTLTTLKQEIAAGKSSYTSSQKQISDLQLEIASTKDTLASTREQQDSIEFFGAAISKSTYSIIMWSLVGILVLLLVILFIRYNHNNAVTVRSRDNLASLQEEYDQFRKRSLEREQKLRRELQDEINKQRRS